MILRAVVFEYVHGAEPVGSEMIVRKYEFGVKSATIRNELAEMSEMGYLEQPHTSAGRIPSDQGYRYYVDHVSPKDPPPEETQDALNRNLVSGEVLQSILSGTARQLSRWTQLMSIAATLGTPNLRAKSALVTGLGTDRALLVLVLSNGHVANRMLTCPVGLTLEDIGRTNEALSKLTTDAPLTKLRTLKAPNGPSASEKLQGAAISAIRGIIDELSQGKVFIEGTEFLFGQPEFHRNPEPFGMLISALEEGTWAHDHLLAGKEHGSLTIGHEHADERLHTFSVIRRPIFVGSEEVAILALLGPTRMNYDASLPLMDYAAQAVSDTLTKMLT